MEEERAATSREWSEDADWMGSSVDLGFMMYGATGGIGRLMDPEGMS